MLALACLAGLAVGAAGYVAVATWAREAASGRLGALADGHARAIEHRWAQLQTELSVHARSAHAVSSFDEISKWMELGDQDRNAILTYYQGDGFLSEEDRIGRSGRDHKHGYSWRHTPIHETYLATLKQFDYADIYLISSNGRVVYSVTKGPEFGRLVTDPDFAATGLGQVFVAARDLPRDRHAVVDFEPYAPVGGEPRAFLAAPFRGNDTRSGQASDVIVIAVNAGLIDSVVSSSVIRASSLASGASSTGVTVRLTVAVLVPP